MTLASSTGSRPRDGLRIAAVQLQPVVLDRARTLERAVAAIDDAGSRGVRLAVLPEAAIGGYPFWLSSHGGARFEDPVHQSLHALALREAVDCDAGDLEPLQEAARRHEMTIAVGIVERPPDRGGHSLFCTAVTILADGSVAVRHRKLVPTYEERLIWAHGDAHGLRTSPLQGRSTWRLGVLNCWENWMPLARAAMHADGENVHAMLWPGSVRNTEILTRVAAREGRSYVVSACSYVTGADVADEARALLDQRGGAPAPDSVIHEGGSCIAGPDGDFIVEPTQGAAALLVADADLEFVRRERQNFDPAGHYARPELLRLEIDRRRAGRE